VSARRLKVLLVIDRVGSAGGAERFTFGLAAHLPRERFDPWVCSTWQPNPATAHALGVQGVRVVSLGRESRRKPPGLWKLTRLLRQERFDVMHNNKFGSNVWGTVIGRACRVPVILAQEHSWSYEGNPLRVWLDGHIVGRLATRFIAVSREDAEAMVRIEGVPEEKVVMIPSASYIPPSTSPPPLRQELSLGADVPVVATACVLRPEKAIPVLLDAFADVVQALPEARLLIAGDGPCRSDLEKQARGLGIGSRVHFLGHRGDVIAVLRAADVAALSSDREGSPLFVAECMAAGTPLVASAVGGVPDMVDHDRTGILVRPRDPVALAEALLRLLRNPSARERLATQASRHLAEYTIDAVAARYGELYEELAREAGIS
jgi:glycosyltransferase involved in cell wall biosynthesis